MEDDHVDRPDVEAQQCVQLTGTNSSIGLIALINRRPSHTRWRNLKNPFLLRKNTHEPAKLETFRTNLMSNLFVFRRPGGSCEVARPDPIPNSAVKRFSANGTMSQDLGE